MFLEGHDVGHHLAGMRAPRQAVDDRHRGMARQFHRTVVHRGADHDGVDIARQHARGIGRSSRRGRAASPAPVSMMTRRRAGACRRRTTPACASTACRRSSPASCRRADLARRRACARAFMARLRRRSCARRSLGGMSIEIEEVAARRSPLITRRSSASAAAAALVEPRRRRGRCARSLRRSRSSLTMSGGSSRTTLSPAATVSIFSARSASTSSAGRHHGVQADQQALAAHLGDHRRMAVLDLGEPLLEQQRDLAARDRGSRARASRRARRCRPPSPADCRRRSSRACRRSCPWPPRRSRGTRRPESRRRAPWPAP